MSKIKKSILCFLSVILILLTSLLQPLSVIAASTSSELSFESSNVLDDLFSSTVDGVPFDIKNFPFNEKSSIQILNFVEFCYTYKESLKDDYGLYVYVYNPQGLDIDKTSKQNKIQLATYSDEFGEHYDKFELEFINEAEQSNYKGLFYKYKIVDKKSADGKTLIDRVNSNERVYKVSGIELLTKGNSNATEYGVGGTYKFTGYAKGYGPDVNAESNLVCTVESLETLSLEVHHTNYRTGVSSLGEDHYNEVNTVYFAVPNRIFKEYGNLQKIRAEWWEYKTKMAAITSNYDYYQNTLMKYVGTYTGEHNSSVDNYLYSGYYGQSGNGYANHYFDWTYNKNLSMQSSLLFTQTYHSSKVSEILPYAFYSPAVDVDSVFKFLYSDPIAGSVDSTQVAEWIYNYSNDLGHGYIDCNGRKISKDLFESSVDSGRTMGYNDKTIDLGDTFDLNSYDSNHTWWDKLWDYGFSWPDTSEQYSNVAPIYELKESDLSGSDTDVSKRLLINSDDVDELKDFFDEAEANDERVILFRFANTDYYCAPAFAPHVQNITKTDTYVAQQTVFLDFDIIELTFNKDGVYHVIPVVSIEDVEELTTTLATIEDGAVIAIPSTIELADTLNIANKEVTFIFSEDFDKAVSVELQEGKLTIMNGHFNGIDISGKGTVILDNVMSQATEEGDSGLSLQNGADVTIQIVGNVSLIGAKNGDGLEVPYGTKLLLTGDTLVAVGNNGVEYTGIDAYNTTDDETYMNMRGSGIGDAVHNIGSLTIKDMASLTAKGYGNKAFGIGGGDKSVVTIENTVIEYAKGGFAQNVFIAGELNYGKQEAEGGCAIGVGCGVDGNYDSGILKMKNVTVKKAEGGSKSAAIGALYWTAVDISIQNCKFEEVIGGTASAGIGGSRVYKGVGKDQYVKIFIDNSQINVTGGQYGAGIGTGYDCYCQTDYAVCYIEIIGDETVINAQGGINAAGIGTGHHSAGLAGYILPECDITAKAGEMFIYETTYTEPQDIGYGMCNPDNELAGVAYVFDIQGEVVEEPVKIIPAATPDDESEES